MQRIFIGLGSNVGDRISHMRSAVRALRGMPGVEVRACSSAYETEPVGDIVQPDFLNAAVEVRSDLTPPEMLKRLKETELRVGRTPGERWGQREIDLDLLFVGDLVVTGERMKVPHPEARNRKFVLIPLAEIASSFPDPLTGRRISDLLQSCTDTKRVTRISESIDV